MSCWMAVEIYKILNDKSPEYSSLFSKLSDPYFCEMITNFKTLMKNW